MKSDLRLVPAVPPGGEEVLSLARAGTEAARGQLRAFTPEQLAGALTSLQPAQRAEFLELVERVEEIVPLLPEAEFAIMVRARGIEDAGWLVEFASAEQRVAAVDLDCWKDLRLSPSRLFEWIDAMIEAGTATLVAAFDELDPEIWVLAMKEMADFSVADTEDPELLTDDGFVFYSPRSAEHEDRVRAILDAARSDSPSHYWRFVYGAMLESRAECEEYAVRWQRGRLNDLGFPDREQAMRVYRPLRAEAVPVPAVELGDTETRALVAAPRPPAMLAGSLVGVALGELTPERAAEVLGGVLGVANSLAVADELALADPESVSSSLRKALRGIERGLAELAKVRRQPLAAVLAGAPPLELFRIGAALDGELRPRRTLAELEEELDRDDWDAETQMIEPEDQTLGEDGRLRK